ncbi:MULTISPECIES: hypothetical protein [unclassified Pseudofrankia]|uniref:hypothetical protein n=1 Tax=unclassified Pseudofrankia TaxID=2994372 RepID=UPI0012FF71AC|nr:MULTISPECIES: hypothetical protein [unclassified Pseudofrankia]MDT3439093.1 hypothetical protein [Pseudofrankia sp. BMG5.37]
MPEAVADLAAFPGPELVVGHVDARPAGGFYSQIFLAPDLDRVVACLGVAPSPTT